MLPLVRSRACSNFYPRPPRGGRHFNRPHPVPVYVFLSTPSARRATAGLRRSSAPLHISIHALREEGDDRRQREL